MLISTLIVSLLTSSAIAAEPGDDIYHLNAMSEVAAEHHRGLRHLADVFEAKPPTDRELILEVHGYAESIGFSDAVWPAVVTSDSLDPGHATTAFDQMLIDARCSANYQRAPIHADLRAHVDLVLDSVARLSGPEPYPLAMLQQDLRTLDRDALELSSDHEVATALLASAIAWDSANHWAGTDDGSMFSPSNWEVDKGDIVDSDVKGAVTAMAGMALVSSVSGGALTIPAVATGAAFGAVVGSYWEYTDQKQDGEMADREELEECDEDPTR